jgi:hypothetical protein
MLQAVNLSIWNVSSGCGRTPGALAFRLFLVTNGLGFVAVIAKHKWIWEKIIEVASWLGRLALRQR